MCFSLLISPWLTVFSCQIKCQSVESRLSEGGAYFSLKVPGGEETERLGTFQTSYISELSKRTCFSLDFYAILQSNASLQHPFEAAEKTNVQPTEMNFKAQLYTVKLSGLGAVLGLAKISLDGKNSLNLVNSMKCSFERQQTTSLKFSQFGLPESVSLLPHQPLSKY